MRDIENTLFSKILELSALKTKVESWKSEGRKVVFTNGVFDLIHIGHITYLSKAAELGDKLIIGLNSDTSVKRIKGADYAIENIVGAKEVIANGGEVKTITFVEGYSSTSIIKKIQQK